MNVRQVLHGAAIAQVLDEVEDVTIAMKKNWHYYLYSFTRSRHRYQDRAIVLMKYSTKPLSAWQFTFSDEEEKALADVAKHLYAHRRFIAFICNRDGVCCVSEDELRTVVDGRLGGKNVSVSRPGNSSYRLSGPGRNQLDRKIPRSDWPKALFGDT